MRVGGRVRVGTTDLYTGAMSGFHTGKFGEPFRPAANCGLCIEGARKADSRDAGMPAQTCESLLADLRRLRLLTDDAGERLATAARLGVDNFPRLLVEAGLTRFQVRVAIAGHAERLVFGPYVLLDKIGEG